MHELMTLSLPLCCTLPLCAGKQVILQATRKKAKTKTMQKDSRCPELPALVAVLGMCALN